MMKSLLFRLLYRVDIVEYKKDKRYHILVSKRFGKGCIHLNGRYLSKANAIEAAMEYIKDGGGTHIKRRLNGV